VRRLFPILFWGMCSILLWGSQTRYFKDRPCCGCVDTVGLHRVFSPQRIQGKFDLERGLISYNCFKHVFKRVMKCGNYRQVARMKFDCILCIEPQIMIVVFDEHRAARDIFPNAFLRKNPLPPLTTLLRLIDM